MVRRIFTITITLASCLSITACNDKSNEFSPTPAAQEPASASAPPAAPAEPITLSSWTGDLSSAEKSELCNLDAVNGSGAEAGRFETALNQPAAFEGWVATSDLQKPEQFSIIFDGGDADFQISGVTGQSRDDVAQAYGTKALGTSGFKLELAGLKVPAGDYAIFLIHHENGRAVACDTKLVLAAK